LLDRYRHHRFENGFVLLTETMPGVRSAAMSLVVPCAALNDPVDAVGLATVVSELTLRGAGPRDSRQLSDDLDRLGLQRSMSTGLYHTRYSTSALSSRVLDGLPLYADIVRRPMMNEADFEPSLDLAMQALEGLADDPRSLALIELRKRHWPEPLGRNAMGEADHLRRISLPQCRADIARRYVPDGSILALAGEIDFDATRDAVERHFGTWSGKVDPVDSPTATSAGQFFVEQLSEQTHIGIACPFVGELEDDYYTARVANEILSGGSSGRLFTEIREKRGLCYSVGTSYAGLKDRGSLLGYAGTSNERAQQTLDAFVAELVRLRDGVDAGEVERAKVGLLSTLVMSGESTSSRAGMIASDYFMRGRVRTLDEVIEKLSAVSHEAVNDLVRRRPLGEFTIVIIGPNELKRPQ
jgi:predicted Zn-dependent peptidase